MPSPRPVPVLNPREIIGVLLANSASLEYLPATSLTWRSGEHSRTMSAHRFALLLAYGQDSACAIGEHRCNEPLCVRVDQEHVIVSTQRANLRYAVSLGRAGAHRAPTDGRTRVERSLAVRAALAGGWDPIAYAQAAGETRPSPTPRLF